MPELPRPATGKIRKSLGLQMARLINVNVGAGSLLALQARHCLLEGDLSCRQAIQYLVSIWSLRLLLRLRGPTQARHDVVQAVPGRVVRDSQLRRQPLHVPPAPA